MLSHVNGLTCASVALVLLLLQVLVAVLETARIVAIALYPITPGVSTRMYQQLALNPEQLKAADWHRDTVWGVLQAQHRTADPCPVFARIEDTVEFVTEPAPQAVAGAGKKATVKAKR